MKDFIGVLNMHGYGVYIYSAYAIVLSALSLHFIKAVRHSKDIRKAIIKRYKESGYASSKA